jgi:hypothetical protein
MLALIVTGDESWVHHYQPETKRASMQRKHPASSVKKKKKKKVWDEPIPQEIDAHIIIE